MIVCIDKQDPSLLLLSVPEEFGEGGRASTCFAVPVMKRSGGLLVCLPRGCISEDLMIDVLAGADPESVLGPSKGVALSLCEEGLDGSPILVGAQTNCLLMDLSDNALPWISEYDPAADNTAVVGFSEEYPNSLPMYSELLLIATEWITSQGSDRVNFYSALEEQEGVATPVMKASSKKPAAPKRVSNVQMMDQLTAVLDQPKLLSARQDQLEQGGTGPAPNVSGLPASSTSPVPPVSAGLATIVNASPAPPVAFAKVAKVVGPPPRVKPPVAFPSTAEVVNTTGVAEEPAQGDGILHAIAQQSTAITALVAHLANTSDPLTDLQGGGMSTGTTKGVQRREKMQAELASGTSTFYLQMMQQLHRRLHPSKPVPKLGSELQHLSFLDYLKDTGGYKADREMGLIMWLLGHVLDALAVDDLHQAKERLALLVVSLEQSVIDKGDWQVAFLLSLAEDPPLSIYQDKASIISPYGRPFANLVPSNWAAVVLAYVKELEILTTKKNEAASPKRGAANPKNADPDAPSPKKKIKFPRKPKDGAPAPKS